MTARQAYYRGEAKEMANCILRGSSIEQTAKEFETSTETVRRRIKLLGYTSQDLVEIREKIKA